MKTKILAPVIFLMIGLSTVKANNSTMANFHPGAGVHNILSTNLPPVLLADIKKEYQDYWITELFEEGKSKRPTYVITLENADQIIKLSSDDSENWVIKSTTIKAV